MLVPFPFLLRVVPCSGPFFPCIGLGHLRGLFGLRIVSLSIGPMTMTDDTVDCSLLVDPVTLVATPGPQFLHLSGLAEDALDQI